VGAVLISAARCCSVVVGSLIDMTCKLPFFNADLCQLWTHAQTQLLVSDCFAQTAKQCRVEGLLNEQLVDQAGLGLGVGRHNNRWASPVCDFKSVLCMLCITHWWCHQITPEPFIPSQTLFPHIFLQ
jgi:hypothetical protein